MHKIRLALAASIFVIFGANYRALCETKDYELVIWNQYNGAGKDRGTKTCKVEAFVGSSVVWKNDRLEIPWEAGTDTKATVKVPKSVTRIERIRITITDSVGNGGGLSEIEFFDGDENLARKSKVTASAFFQSDKRFGPDRVIDGITSSKEMFLGYWLLPDKKPDGRLGWIELRLPRK
jgi:hypothetical protein